MSTNDQMIQSNVVPPIFITKNNLLTMIYGISDVDHIIWCKNRRSGHEAKNLDTMQKLSNSSHAM